MQVSLNCVVAVRYAETIAFALGLQDMAAMRQAVQGRPSQSLVAKHLGPVLQPACASDVSRTGPSYLAEVVLASQSKRPPHLGDVRRQAAARPAAAAGRPLSMRVRSETIARGTGSVHCARPTLWKPGVSNHSGPPGQFVIQAEDRRAHRTMIWPALLLPARSAGIITTSIMQYERGPLVRAGNLAHSQV